ncbi:hypothetical protein TNCV_228101 [Trichonephila clavipes]|nr:hypothetical protein TNCV_228101 [Trichonephila clavipes]
MPVVSRSCAHHTGDRAIWLDSILEAVRGLPTLFCFQHPHKRRRRKKNSLLDGETIGRAEGCEEEDEFPEEAEEGNLQRDCRETRKVGLVMRSRKQSSWRRERALCNVSRGRMVGTLQRPSEKI